MKHIQEEISFSFESERLNDIGSWDHVARVKKYHGKFLGS